MARWGTGSGSWAVVRGSPGRRAVESCSRGGYPVTQGPETRAKAENQAGGAARLAIAGGWAR